MAGQIVATITHSLYSANSNPISGSYPQVATVLSTISAALAANSNAAAVNTSWTSIGTNTGGLIAIELVANQNCVIQTNNNGAVGQQTVTIGGTPSGGTFVLGYNGAITSNLAYNTNAATLQTALRSLSTIGGTNVNCSGGPFPASPMTIAFGGSLLNSSVPLLTSNISGLTGGSPTIAIANLNTSPQDVIPLTANIPLAWDTQCGLACPFAGSVNSFYVTCSNATNLKGTILTY